VIYKKSWKYILVRDDSFGCSTLRYYRPKAIKDFSDVHKNDIGGFMKRYGNLSQFGNCWIYEEAVVIGEALVSENAKVYKDSCVCGNAQVYGNAIVTDCAIVMGNAKIYNDAEVSGYIKISGDKVLTKGVYK
jgi:NDP-sugar pyrophosphorylase family protein